MKHYPPEFKADAVALYESRPEATIRPVAADLGVNPETLRNWGALTPDVEHVYAAWARVVDVGWRAFSKAIGDR
jgi:hypothetical protein